VLPGWLLSSSLSPHSPVQPDHEHPEPEECEHQLPDHKGGQQQIDDAFSQDEYFPYFCLTKDGEKIRQLDWINIGTVDCLDWFTYLRNSFSAADPLLFLNTLKVFVNYLIQIIREWWIIESILCCCLLFPVLVKERAHPINSVLAFSISVEIITEVVK